MKKWAMIAAAVLMCLLASAAFAAEPIVINVNGDETYTLENVIIENGSRSAIEITGSGSLTLNLVGDNILSANYYGIVCNPGVSLTITGTGTLTATGGEGGVWLHKGDLTISGGTIAAEGTGSVNGYGLINNGGSVTINGGKVTAEGVNGGIRAFDALVIEGEQTEVTASSSSGSAIGGETIAINSGSVAAHGQMYGIHAYGSVTIASPNVEASGQDQYAVDAWDELQLNGVVAAHRNGADASWELCTENVDCSEKQFKTGEALTVTFDKGEGSGTMYSQIGMKGVALQLPECGFTPPAGHAFKAWSVNGEEKQPGDEITVTDDANVTALYELKTYTVTVQAEPAEGGVVTGAGTYKYGDTAELTAEPAGGYLFTGWLLNGQMVSTETVYSMTVTEDVQIIAMFEAQLPKTGDGTPLMLLAMLMTLSMAGLVFVRKPRKC